MGYAEILEKLVNPSICCQHAWDFMSLVFTFQIAVYRLQPALSKMCLQQAACCRWGGAAPKAAESQAKPSVVKADKAVNDAMESKQQTSDTPTHSKQNSSEAAGTSHHHSNQNAIHQQSNKGVDGLYRLSQRPTSQS